MAITKINTPELFDLGSTNTSLQLPSGNTASRPSSPSTGEWRFNTDDNKVEYWDGSAWTTIEDEGIVPTASENFNVNTYVGSGATQAIDAKFNEAAVFNGSSSSIATPITTNYSNLSISCWVKFNALPTGNADATLVSKGFYVSGSNTQYLHLRYEDFTDQFTFAIRQNSTYNQQAVSGVTATTGVWYHVVGTLDSSGNAQIYVNGSAGTGITSAPTMTNSDDFEIGSFATTVSLLNGSIDQVRIFNTALTASQVTDLYTNETTATAQLLDFPVGAGCIAAYELDGDASDVGGTYGGIPTDIGYTGLKFQPDLVWIKQRNTTQNHRLFDSVRGVTKLLASSNTDAEATNTQTLTSFDLNGFTLGNNVAVNTNSGTYVAWNWKAGGTAVSANSIEATNATRSANVDAGFSIIKFTASSSTASPPPMNYIEHGLNATPEMVIYKATGVSQNWIVQHKDLNQSTALYLDLTNGVGSPATYTFFDNTTTSIGVRSNYAISRGDSYIAYAFHSVDGMSKIGSYVATGGSNYIVTGFRPAFVMIKDTTDGVNNWVINDSARDTSNPLTSILFPNLSNAEGDNIVFGVNFLSNGFEIPSTTTSTAYNKNGNTYIFMAFAADPAPEPVLANSFDPVIYTGNGGTQNVTTSFQPDLVWIKNRNNSANSTWSHSLFDSVRTSGWRVKSDSTDAENNYSVYMTGFNSNGFSLSSTALNDSAGTYVAWNWKAAGIPAINQNGTIDSIVSANPAAGFSVAKYTGNLTASTVGHGLSSAPELIIVKRTDSTSNWFVYSETLIVQEQQLHLTFGIIQVQQMRYFP
jgi:hypothetical protein